MPINRVISTLADQRYIEALERELEYLRSQIEVVKRDLKEVRARL